ncbi:MAG: hypothetical protein WAV28_11830, partial [Sedimentisphaerales bacterium]
MAFLSKTFKLSGSRPIKGPKGKGSNGTHKQNGEFAPTLSCTRTNVNAGTGESKSGGLLIYLAICLCALPAQAKYEGGAGTAGDPYLIFTAKQMNEIGTHPGDWNKHFLLIADVNMSDITATEYNIIENFTGIFDGNNCTISNFSLASTREENTGLFGSVGGEIKNLGLLKPDIF